MNRIEYAGLVFTDDDDGHYEIKTASCHKVCALLSDALEVDTFNAELLSATPLTPFTRNDPLTWYHRDRLIGTFYIQSVKRIAADKYRLEATSAVGLLMQTDHYGGIYTGQTVADVVADICNVPVMVKTSLQGTKLYGWLPIASRRDNLSQVLFAIGATAKTDYNGVLRIEGLWDGVSGEIEDRRIFMGDSVEYAADVTEVIVLEHQYVEGAEEDTLFDGTALQGDIITFSEPMHSLSAQGFTILERGANYAKLSAGSGTLTGKKYIHTTRAVSKPVAEADQENTVTVKEATLVSLANSEAVAARLANYYASVQTVEHDIVHQSEMPGDVVTLNHPYDDVSVSGCVESIDMNLSGMLRATQRVLLGYTPPDVGETEYYDTAEILTGLGVWTAPEGVSNIRAVLIGSGNGGEGGVNGEDGEGVSIIVTAGNAPAGSTHQRPPGKGGEGGTGGTGGTGGKILQTVLDVAPAQQFSYSCPVGGIGGGVASSGASGEDTQFGALSSANGSSSNTGFSDIFTGKIYGAKGVEGTKGGKGGDGGQTSGTGMGQDGESVGTYIGGTGGNPETEEFSTSSQVRGGHGGSGAADGSNGKTESNTRSSAPAGANAVKHPKDIDYGCGGRGGNGGGGGAGAGGERIYLKVTQSGGLWRVRGGGQGGAGTPGYDGGDGCVIIYYRIPKPVQRGAVKDKNGLLILDKYGRQLVV